MTALRHRFFLLILFLTGLGQVARAQPPGRAAFARMSLAEGLTQHSVTALLQDRQGFIWAGTQDGLNRFDGYRFRPFRTGEAGLFNAYIRSLTEDNDGRIWLGSDYGLACYDPRTERFTSYLPRSEKTGGLSDPTINAVAVTGTTLWVGTQRAGLWQLDLKSSGALDPKRARFTKWQAPVGSAALADSAIQQLRPLDGALWLGLKAHGVQRLDLGTGRLQSFAPPAGVTADAWRVWEMALDAGVTSTGGAAPTRGKKVWLATNQGLFRLELATGAITQHLREETNPVWTVAHDHAGNTWVGVAEKGLYCLPAGGGPTRHYRYDPADPASLAVDGVIQVLVDRANSLWVGLDGGGLARYDPQRQALRGFTAANGQAFDPGAAQRGMAEDSLGNLWLADAANNTIHYLNPRTGEARKLTIPVAPGEIALNLGTNVARLDRRGRLWLATLGAGVVRYDPATNHFTKLAPVWAKLGSQEALAATGLDLDARGRVWCGTAAGGVICWDEAANTVRQWRQGPGASDLGTNNILGIRVDPASQQILIGTWGAGLHRLDPATGRVTRYPVDPAAPGALPALTVLDVLTPRPDGSGGAWVGTSTGLFRAATMAGPFKRVPGLAANIIYMLTRDPNDRVWALGERSFASIGSAGAPAHNYEFASANQYSYGGLLASRAGQVVVGTQEGMIGFFPDRLDADATPPPVVITGAEVLNKPVVPGQPLPGTSAAALLAAPSYTTEPLTLRPGQNVLTLAYTALSYPQAARTRYAYRLVGFEENWVDAADKRTATYTNLPAGTYHFEVRAQNAAGVWSTKPATLAVRVLPPWYRTTWAYALWVLLIGGLAWLAARIWLARQQGQLALTLKNAEAARLAELDQVKTRFFTNISHEFRTPLTLILGPLEKWRTETTPTDPARRQREEDAMRRNARRLLELINQLLDVAKLEAGSLRLDAAPHDLAALARPLTYSFASLAETRGITLSFDAPTNLPLVALDPPKFETVLTNLIANALKFTPSGGSVTVAVARTSRDNVALTVRDTGVGIAPDQLPHVFDRFYQADTSTTRGYEGTGIGLALVKELVALHGGTVSVSSREGEGTTFTISLLTAGVDAASASPLTPPLDPNDRHADAGGIHALVGEVKTNVKGVYADVEESTTEFSADALASSPDDGRPLVLLVEDHPDVRAYLHDQFDPAQWRVAEAVDGQAGLEAARQLVPDLVITDLMMPRMDGVELTRLLKTEEATSHIPVVLLTAKATVESRLEGLETGADDYLTKPFQPQELLARARNLVASRQKLREKFSQEVRQVQVREIKLEAAEVRVQSVDERFIQKALRVVEDKLADDTFDVEEFASAMALSRVQLYRKLKALTDQTPTDFIRTLRLRRAAQLLDQQAGNVAEVAYSVGFQNLSYFAKTFKELHGVAPSEWRKPPLQPPLPEEEGAPVDTRA